MAVLRAADPTSCDWESYAEQLDKLAQGKGPAAGADDKASEGIDKELEGDEKLASQLCEADIRKLEAAATPVLISKSSSSLSAGVLESLSPETFAEERKDCQSSDVHRPQQSLSAYLVCLVSHVRLVIRVYCSFASLIYMLVSCSFAVAALGLCSFVELSRVFV